MKRIGIAAAAAAGASLLLPTAAIAAQRTAEDPMLVPVADGWSNVAISTVGETIGAYTPPGLLDGMSAYAARGRGVMSVFVNHELRSNVGYAYTLANGTSLTGARISRYDVQTNTLKVIDAEPAYDTIYDVAGDVVTSAAQVSGGLGRFCSGRGVSAGEFGFVDDIHFAGEEQTNGVLYALDTATRELWAVPDAGRLGWENVSPVDTGDPGTVALLIGDDREGAPLWLYVGEKQPGGTFLERNGLTGGTLYAWVADEAGVDSPAEFSGNGTTAAGSWVAIGARDGDSLRTTAELDAAADTAGHFAFSRPEDVHENPDDGQQLVLASTGREGFDGDSDVYGTTYLVDLEFSDGWPTGTDLTILYDGDEAFASDGADAILRSPDNLTWASDGKIYVQEDRAIDGAWGTVQASIWQLDPAALGEANRIAVADQSAVPADQTLPGGGTIGQWETSGIIDVTHLVKGGAPLALLYNVQAHGVGGGRIADLGLAEGGQLGLLTFTG